MGLWVNLYYLNVLVSIKLKLSRLLFPASGPDRLSAEGGLLIGLLGSFPKVLVNSRSKSVFATSPVCQPRARLGKGLGECVLHKCGDFTLIEQEDGKGDGWMDA